MYKGNFGPKERTVAVFRIVPLFHRPPFSFQNKKQFFPPSRKRNIKTFFLPLAVYRGHLPPSTHPRLFPLPSRNAKTFFQPLLLSFSVEPGARFPTKWTKREKKAAL